MHIGGHKLNCCYVNRNANAKTRVLGFLGDDLAALFSLPLLLLNVVLWKLEINIPFLWRAWLRNCIHHSHSYPTGYNLINIATSSYKGGWKICSLSGLCPTKTSIILNEEENWLLLNLKISFTLSQETLEEKYLA